MKKIIIPFIIILVIILVIFFVFGVKKKVIIKDLKHLHLSFSNGYAMYAYTIYDAAAEFFANEVINILNKYNVTSWDGFNKSDRNVLDGDSFSFSLRYDEDKEVDAHGYMRYPNNYRDVKQELIDIFTNYYKD